MIGIGPRRAALVGGLLSRAGAGFPELLKCIHFWLNKFIEGAGEPMFCGVGLVVCLRQIRARCRNRLSHRGVSQVSAGQQRTRGNSGLYANCWGRAGTWFGNRWGRRGGAGRCRTEQWSGNECCKARQNATDRFHQGFLLAVVEPKFAEGLSVRAGIAGAACVAVCRTTRRQKMKFFLETWRGFVRRERGFNTAEPSYQAP